MLRLAPVSMPCHIPGSLDGGGCPTLFRTARISRLALAAALALVAGSCAERELPGGSGELRLRLGGSGLSDEWRSLRVVAFDLAEQGCIGPRVAEPGATPLATSGLAHPESLRLTLSIPAGARTIYVEVYRDGDGTDLLGTGCAETVLAPGESATVQVEIVLLSTDADADADADDVVDAIDADAGDDAGGDVEADGDDAGDADGDADADDAADVDDDVADDAADVPAEDAVAEADAPPVPGLVLSEVDYDQTGTDSLEFVELYNASADPVPCAGLELRLINGVGSALYRTQPLTCSAIAPGSVHVVGSSLLLASITCPSAQVLGTGGSDLVQNGPPSSGGPGDAVALVDASSGAPVVLDQVAYEGAVAGWGEGGPAAEESSSTESLQRNPPGHDTDDNAADFRILPPTPCAVP
ncbi:MAG: lamin tail domain-containing protein [Deltaproteobacteria bacterium]|nr:lamin tail domain-containing protein [Deltaproteobacteria bacterium]